VRLPPDLVMSPAWGAAPARWSPPPPAESGGGPVEGPSPAASAGIADRESRRGALLRPGTLPGGASNGSWNGALDNPSTASAMRAISGLIGAASALSARGRTYGKEKIYGSIP
jgi:hypothetical protein